MPIYRWERFRAIATFTSTRNALAITTDDGGAVATCTIKDRFGDVTQGWDDVWIAVFEWHACWFTVVGTRVDGDQTGLGIYQFG